jgi:PAS domain S-box-containing protein
VRTWNAGAERIKGYRADEIIGKSFSVFYTPESNSKNHPQRELEHAKKFGVYEEEGWRVRKDGSLFWADVVITAVRDGNSELIGFAKVTRDLTERRKSDQERDQAFKAAETFRLMVATVKDYAIFMLDPEGRVMTWNEGAQRIKGYSESEIIGKHFSIFYSDEANARKHPQEELKIATKEGRYEEEGWRLRKDGSRFWANVVITAVRDTETGELLGFAKVTRDLTERKRTEEEREKAASELRQLNHELIKANSAKDYFLANMSHELRTPLNSIIGFNEVMLLGLSGPLNDTQRKQAQFIQRAADHLLSLINDILDLAKVESGNMSLASIELQLSTILEDVVATLKPLADERKLSLELAESCKNNSVRGDERAVKQILTNLISNGIKFTDEGGVAVSCSSDDSHVFIQIKDTGIGIARTDQSLLFKGFVQLARAQRKQEGTGLGLALSKRLAILMNGDISLESDTGKGSTFTLKLLKGK